MRAQDDVRIARSVRGLIALSCCLLPAHGAAIHGPLKAGKVYSNKIASGQSQAYEVTLEPRRFMHVVLVQPAFATVLRLYSPDRREILIERKLAGGIGRREPLYWIGSTSGRYRVELSTDEPGKPAGFGIELKESRKAEAKDESLVAGQERFERARVLSEKLESEQAAAFWQQALASFEQSGDREREGVTLLNLGLEYHKQQHFDQETGTLEKALAIFREIREPGSEGDTLRSLGSAYLSLDQNDRAVALYDQAIAIYRQAKDRQGELRVLNMLGNSYIRRAPDKAINYYDQALALARATNDRFFEERLLHNLGSVKIRISRDQEAVGDFQMSLAIARGRNDQLIIASSLNGLGYAYNNLDRYDEAIRRYDEALPILRELKDRDREASALNNLGLAYSNINQFEKAVPIYEQSLALFRELHDRYWERQVLHNIAWSYDNLNQHAKAVPIYQQALAIARELNDHGSEGRLLMDVADSPAQLEEALALLREAKDRQAEAWTLRILGGAYRKDRQFDKAAQLAAQSVALAHEIKEPSSEASSLAVLMHIYKDLGLPRLATFYGKRAVNILQSVRSENRGLSRDLRQGLAKGYEETYHTLADLLIGQGRLAEAEQVLALLKDEEYFNFLRRDADEADLNTRKAGLTREEEAYDQRFREIEDRLVAIGTERGALLAKSSLNTDETQRLSKIEQDIAAGNVMFAKFLDDLKVHFGTGPASARVDQLAEAQGIMEDLRDLPSGTVAIYTLVADDKFREILVTPDVQKAYEYPISGADLNRKVLAFREVLQDPTADPRPLARELYSILIEKMAGDLEQAKAQTLMWSLDGTLRYLPLAALFDGRQYLVEKFAVSMFTPVSNARLKERPDRDWRAAGFGVTKAYEGEPALPAVASELEGIIARKPGETGVLKGEIKLDSDFTQTAMRTTLRKRFQVVHIASHFNFQPGNETASFLLMGDGTHLSLASLKNMPSLFGGVQLLTLSACNTGVGGDGGNGQEIEGFGRLAQDRGAKAVVASLWSVMDSSTSLLMQQFYRLRQSSTKLTKAEALRQAQLLLLHGGVKEDVESTRGVIPVHATRPADSVPFHSDPAAPYAHPYHWGAFFLMGNWL